jgi:hypothetical protein
LTPNPWCIALRAVAFTLRVTQTGSEPEELPFDTAEVRMGRTADNDVVIKDPSSSRSHARIYEEAGGYLVEDLKSANGTKLNGKALKQPMPLKNGDKIMIGDVSLEVVIAVAETNDTVMGAPSSTFDESAAEAPPAEEEDPNATMLRPPQAPVNLPKRPPARRAPEPPPDEEGPADGADATANVEVGPPRALAKKGASAPAPARPSRGLAKAEKEEAAPALSAAERARQRRELSKSSAGKLQVFWMDLPLPGKIAVGVFGGGLILALLGFTISALIPKKVQKRIEVIELAANGDPVPESYGLGDDVDFERPDMKGFNFTYASPTSIVGVLHYQARDCSKDEVSIELNGQQLGAIPPDTVEVAQRQLEIVLPAQQLKINEPNEVVFDNVNNPPGEDTWRVWNVWVEVIPVPQMTAEEAGRRAKEEIEKGARMYDLKDVGAMNMFRSWKQYRDAWLMLEATPDRPPELLEIARTRMREIRPELDRKCSGMLVDFQKEVNQKYPDVKKARMVLQNITLHFEKEHPCFGMSRGMLRSLEELSGEPE